MIQLGLEFTANQGKMILLGVAPMGAGLELAVVPYMVVSVYVLLLLPWQTVKLMFRLDGQANHG